MKILIVYGTSEGHTRKIARYIEDVLQNEHHNVVIADASDEPPNPKNFDAVFIGSSIHMHKYQGSVHNYIMENVQELNLMPSAFFSVSMAMASNIEQEQLEVQEITNKFLNKTKWNPLLVDHLAGALRYTKYDYFKRLLMRMIAKRQGGATDTSKDHEYTDWNKVKNFAHEFVSKADKQLV